MSTDEPNKRLLLAFIGVLLLGVIIFNSKPLTLNSGQLERKEGVQIKDSGVIIFQGNTLVAFVPSTFPRVQVFGVMVDERNKKLIEKILFCESSNRHYLKDGSVIKGKLDEIGIAQFRPKTWQWFNELRGTNLDIYNKEHQIDMLRWGLENGKENHWTCYRKIN